MRLPHPSGALRERVGTLTLLRVPHVSRLLRDVGIFPTEQQPRRLDSLHSAQPSKRRHNRADHCATSSSRSVRSRRLKPRPQQTSNTFPRAIDPPRKISTGRNSRNSVSRKPRTAFRISLKRNCIGKHKEKSRSTAGYFPSGCKLHRPQPSPVQLLQIELRQKYVLPQLARRRHFRMNLPKLRHHRAIHQRPRRPSRMKILRRFPVSDSHPRRTPPADSPHRP